MEDHLVIAGKPFKSRLIVGTGKYRTMEEMVQAIEASGTEMVTVAIRRLDLDNPNEKTILDWLDWDKYNVLPKHRRMPHHGGGAIHRSPGQVRYQHQLG